MEGLARHWAESAVALCRFIDDDEELEEYRTPVTQALHALDHDRRIIAIGGAKSGKSELLSGLARAPVIAHTALQKHYTCWRYCCRDGDATQSRFIPVQSLDGLELVDTADCEQEDTRKMCQSLMQGADVLLAVVHAASPVDAPVWTLLDLVPKRLVCSCILVVTHTENVDAQSALKLKDTIRNLCRARLHCALPTCLLPTQRSTTDMEGIRSLVQDILQGEHGVRRSISTLVERSLELVEKQNRILRTRESVSRTNSGFLAGIDREIDNFHARQVLGIEEHRRSLNAVLIGMLPEFTNEVRHSFGILFSPVTLLRLEMLGNVADRIFHSLALTALNNHQEESDLLFCNSCASHWRSVRPRMKRNLSCEIGDFPEEQLEKQIIAIRNRFCNNIYEPFDTGGMRQRLCLLFIAQAEWMNVFFVLCCSFLILAGTMGALGQDAAGLACLLFSLTLWGLGSLKLYFARQRICSGIETLIRDFCEEMDRNLPSVLERFIASRLSAYRELYSVPREKVARQEALLRPLKKQRDIIHLQLRALLPHL